VGRREGKRRAVLLRNDVDRGADAERQRDARRLIESNRHPPRCETNSRPFFLSSAWLNQCFEWVSKLTRGRTRSPQGIYVSFLRDPQPSPIPSINGSRHYSGGLS